MEIIKYNIEVLIGTKALGYTHLCFVEDYFDEYKVSKQQIDNAKNAGAISSDEYDAIISEMIDCQKE